MAALYSYAVFEVVCYCNYTSIHNVPDDVIQRMKDNFEL